MDLVDPVSNRYLNSSCDKAFNGWPCDPAMEKLRDRFAGRDVQVGQHQ